MIGKVKIASYYREFTKCDCCAVASGEFADIHSPGCAKVAPPTMEELLTVERAVRRFLKEGLRLTPEGLIVREKDDDSDPYMALCDAVDAIEPLNDPEQSRRAVEKAMARFKERAAALTSALRGEK